MSSLHAGITLCTALFALATHTTALSPPHDRGPLFNNSLVVHSLDVAGYEAMVNDTDVVWLVDYYSSWCAHCRMFAPEWEKVGGLYASSSVVQIGAVNCNQYKDICVREGVHAYPAVKAHHVPLGEKSIVEMGIKGQKKVKSVVKWVEELLEQHNIESGADISTLVEENKLRRNEPDEAAAAATGGTEGLDGDNYVDMKLKRLRDAGKATMLTLENSLFMGTPVLEGERYDAALMWVNALAKTLPMEGNRLAFVALANDMKQQTRWEPDEWSELLKKWRTTAKKLSFPSDLFDANGDEEVGWASCTTYTCGLWTLFHSMTVKMADTESSSEAWKPSTTVAAIRLYVKNFFGCAECREHFMAANPESVVEEIAAYDSKGTHAGVMWAWKMHNTVNKVLKRDQWPSISDCSACYIDIGGEAIGTSLIQEDEIVAYLTSLYSHENKAIFEQNILNATLLPMQGFNAILSTMVLLIALVAVVVKTKMHLFAFSKDSDHIA